LKFRAWGDVLFKQLWTGILELCKTILCETVGILARQGRRSCSERLSRPEMFEFSRLQVALILFPMTFSVEGSMMFYVLEILASRSALSSSSPGWKKNKTHAVLEVS